MKKNEVKYLRTHSGVICEYEPGQTEYSENEIWSTGDSIQSLLKNNDIVLDFYGIKHQITNGTIRELLHIKELYIWDRLGRYYKAAEDLGDGKGLRLVKNNGK